MVRCLAWTLSLVLIASCSDNHNEVDDPKRDEHVNAEKMEDFISEAIVYILTDSTNKIEERFIDPNEYASIMLQGGSDKSKDQLSKQARMATAMSVSFKMPKLAEYFIKSNGEGFSLKNIDSNDLEPLGGRYPHKQLALTIGTPDPNTDVLIKIPSVALIDGAWKIIFGYSKDSVELASSVPDLYNAVISCGMNNQNINVLACFTKTDLEVKVDNRTTVYKSYNLQSAGEMYQDGLHIQLPSNFSLVAQNSQKNMVLSVVIYDGSNNVVYQNQVGQWGVINVGN